MNREYLKRAKQRADNQADLLANNRAPWSKALEVQQWSTRMAESYECGTQRGNCFGSLWLRLLRCLVETQGPGGGQPG